MRREHCDKSLGCGARRGLVGEGVLRGLVGKGVLRSAEGNSLLLIRMARGSRSEGLQAGEG